MQTDTEFLRGRRLPSLYSESVGEYSLPDYNTDVKKLLLVRAKPVSSGRFLDADSLKFSGVVGYDVVYVDKEDEVTHCEFTTDYDVKVKCDSETYCDSDVTTSLLGVNLRLLGPRKFSVKTSLHSEGRVIERETISVGGDGLDTDCAEIAKKDLKVATAKYSENCEREYAEELTFLEGVIEDDVELLVCSSELKINSVSVSENEVEYKGELQFEALVKVEDGCPSTYKKTLPVSEKINFPDVSEGSSCEVNVVCVSITASAVAEESGVKLNLSVITDARACAYENENISVITDGFRRDREVNCEYRDFKYTELLGRERGEENFSSELARGEEEPDVRNVLFTSVCARLEEAQINGECLTMSGILRFNGIGCKLSDEGEVEYVSMKYDLPFSQNVNISCHNEGKIKPAVIVKAIDGYIETDPVKTYFGCKLLWDVKLYAEKETEYLCACSASDVLFCKDESVITVYYPSEKESLFDVAKKFHTSVLALAESNELTDSAFSSAQSSASLAGVKRLIVK